MRSIEKDLLIKEKQRLIALYEIFKEIGPFEEEAQLRELFLKLSKEEFSISFFGHFSAGKSSLINALSQTGILPASPIPTSANVVKLKKGSPGVVVRLRDNKQVTIDYPYDIQEVKDLCKDGEHVRDIEVRYDAGEDVSDLVLFDTPGIDSTDPAHKKATEEVIYLSDLIFYVMDYNHILSETNVHFIKELVEKGKSVRLIINQIDKHDEEELPFASFKENVFESFKQYGINKEQIFFTSVKDPTFPNNDLAALIAYLKNIELKKDELLLHETNNQVRHLIQNFVEEQKKDRPDVDQLIEELQYLRKEKLEVDMERESADENHKERVEAIRTGFTKIVDTAQLMPYDTRVKAGELIESMKKDFKVGLFFSKQKTENERQQRLESFLTKLQELIDSNINWHAQSYVKAYQNVSMDWKPIILSKETLLSYIQPGLSSEGQGLLNYCDNVSGEIKKLARKQMNELLQQYIDQIDEENQQFKKDRLKKSTKLGKRIAELEMAKEAGMTLQLWKTRLLAALEQPIQEPFNLGKYQDVFNSAYESISLAEFKALVENEIREEAPPEMFTEEQDRKETKSERVGTVKEETEELRKKANILMPVSQMKHMAQEMVELSDRLEKNSFTMVLFGAFSAGKSSFANALFGKHILPSSPNPTTATINEIKKPDETNEHGSVMIEMKSEEEIISELKSFIETESKHLEAVLKELESGMKKARFDETQTKHVKAFIDGYPKMKSSIGKQVETTIQYVAEYASVETTSCYVKKITIFYSCPLTDKGLVLVDTPGANSIHSRHTEVAFEYMKHADVIVYLTYFNHAFSYADREFLIQLGRIKDTFASDKMFFAINAADLAENEEDKQAVVDHVKQNLLTFGIRNPRLFPVSSKNELDSKNDRGFELFTKSLYHYLENDLEQAMVKSARYLQNHANQVIQNMIEETRNRIEEEDAYLEGLEKREHKVKVLRSQSLQIESKLVEQEIKELLFYVKQRVMIRYHDIYKETIHPASVQSSRHLLQEALDTLYSRIAHDLEQEFRASSLRIDKWIQKDLKIKEETFIEKAKELKVDLKPSTDHNDCYKTPHSPSFTEDWHSEHKEWLTYFKNAKQFFEQGGSEALKNNLITKMDEQVENWLELAKLDLEEHYDMIVHHVEQSTTSHYENQIDLYFTELKKPGDLEGRINMLSETLKKIS